MLRRLIKYGAKVDVRDRISREPLMWAASSGKSCYDYVRVKLYVEKTFLRSQMNLVI